MPFHGHGAADNIKVAKTNIGLDVRVKFDDSMSNCSRLMRPTLSLCDGRRRMTTTTDGADGIRCKRHLTLA